MVNFTETLAVVDSPNPDSGALELLVGAQKRGPWQNWFNFIGGKLDEGEPVTTTAVRELEEDTSRSFQKKYASVTRNGQDH